MKEEHRTAIDESDSAFPFAFVDKSNSEFDGEQIVSLGMSIRDYFAAQSIAGMWSNAQWVEECARQLRAYPNEEFTVGAMFAQKAYETADAMLKARER